jgi:hypothetical protein
MKGQRTINLANKALDLLALTDIENRRKIEIADLIVEMRKEAINYSQCCTELKVRETPTFEEWLKDKFIKISDTDYTNKDQDCIWGYYELQDIYKLMN